MGALSLLSLSLSQLSGLCLSIFIVYLVVDVTRNLYFSPLSHIPGPFFAKISTIPSCYYAWRGDRHIWLWRNFQIYGHKVRIAPDVVLYNDPQIDNQIYSHKANLRRADFYSAWQRNKADVNTMNTTDNAVHAKKRRILNLVFTDKAVKSAGEFVYRHVDRWHELLVPSPASNLNFANGGEKRAGVGWGETVNMADKIDCLVFDILGDLCFGKSFGIKEPGENRLKSVPHTIVNYVTFMYPVARSPFVDFILLIKPYGLDTLMEIISPQPVKDYFKFVEDSVTERLALETSYSKQREAGEPVRADMFHYLASATDPETGKPAYSERELRCESLLLIIAGSDTTAITLCGVFFYLTLDTSAKIYEKLVAEIMSTFTSAEEIALGPKLMGCTYMRACIDEAMRLVPPGPSELSRTVLAGGMTIDGDFLPEGITVGASGWCMGHLNAAVYGDSTTYRPDRWIVDEAAGNTAEKVEAVRNCHSNFSRGPSSCVGKNLAILEMLTVIGRTLYRFDVRRAPGSKLGQGASELGWGKRDPSVFQLRDAYISVRNGPELQFRRRVD